ncbi:MAG: hypothetical protein AB1566_12785, partial [Chloroflexota bacterium]
MEERRTGPGSVRSRFVFLLILLNFFLIITALLITWRQPELIPVVRTVTVERDRLIYVVVTATAAFLAPSQTEAVTPQSSGVTPPTYTPTPGPTHVVGTPERPGSPGTPATATAEPSAVPTAIGPTDTPGPTTVPTQAPTSTEVAPTPTLA